jgi:hypothetical protein
VTDANGQASFTATGLAPILPGQGCLTATATDPAGNTSEFSADLLIPTVRVADAGGTYNGGTFPATATVTGVLAGVDDTPSASLEGLSPTLTYYVGTYASAAQLVGL